MVGLAIVSSIRLGVLQGFTAVIQQRHTFKSNGLLITFLQNILPKKHASKYIVLSIQLHNALELCQVVAKPNSCYYEYSRILGLARQQFSKLRTDLAAT